MKNGRQTDHDLLIELRTEVANIRQDIKELKDGTTMRIESLERDKADRHDFEELQNKVNHDIDVRVRKLEDKAIYIYAFAAGVGVAASLIVNYFSNVIK
jgi:hypothetical protein